MPTDWEPNVRLVGEKVTAGAGVTPVPVRATCCGLPPASSAMTRDAVSAAFEDGVKVTLMLQVPPAAATVPLVGQAGSAEAGGGAKAKSALFVPLIVRLDIFSGRLPTLVSVTVCGALVLPFP